jgi:diguanylate cyclase (GGDEF)-like protein
VLEGATDREEALALCSDLKKDPFTAVVPIVVLVLADQTDLISDWLAAGADEVVSETHSEREQDLRLELVIRRAQRDVAVHPTTRLPGTVQIERNIADRLRYGEEFAVCYADLDNFKEFNDRYGYNHGDHVILLLSRILRDVVRGLAPEGFVGHIGGDDFIFIVNLKYLEACCDEIIYLFDELIPYQYTVEDRRAGYFLGKDRRGSIRRVPLMTLSIGVVTNQIQPFTHTAQVSELAAEMKTYTKSLPGSVYAVDRRRPLKEEVEQS